MPVPILLTPAASNDLEALVAIRLAAMRESLERIGRYNPERARARFVEGFEVASTRRIERAGALVGFVVVKHRHNELLLDHLYVMPAAQGAGIGAQVLTQLFEEADEAALPMRVGALKESASNRFYLRHGFVLVESGDFDHYYLRRPVAAEGGVLRRGGSGNARRQ